MLNRNHLILFFIFLAVFDFIVWQSVLAGKQNENLELYFLDVGQGDGELAILPDGVKILIDGGPNNKILSELSSVLKPTDKYIDLVVMTHPQYDHFAGLIDVLKRYQVGAFIYNGRRGEIAAFGDLEKILKDKNIPVIVLGESDKIKHQENIFNILSPSKEFLSSKELNDTTLVIELINNNFKALFTGDIGFNIENYLAEKYDIKVDVLKVGHHGSKYSSGNVFLKKTNPKISIIEVGKNSYGHPTKNALNRLANIGSQIFRTDQDGAVKLIISGKEINIFKKK